MIEVKERKWVQNKDNTISTKHYINNRTENWKKKKVFGEFLILQKSISIVFETSIFPSFSLFITSFNGLCLKTLLRNAEHYLNHNCLILLHSTKLNK